MTPYDVTFMCVLPPIGRYMVTVMATCRFNPVFIHSELRIHATVANYNEVLYTCYTVDCYNQQRM